jgi:hypothetical protein
VTADILGSFVRWLGKPNDFFLACEKAAATSGHCCAVELYVFPGDKKPALPLPNFTRNATATRTMVLASQFVMSLSGEDLGGALTLKIKFTAHLLLSSKHIHARRGYGHNTRFIASH